MEREEEEGNDYGNIGNGFRDGVTKAAGMLLVALALAAVGLGALWFVATGLADPSTFR